jgi:hypothetical protein
MDNTATYSLWNGLSMRPDGGWAGNLCAAHLDWIQRTQPHLGDR